MNTPSQNLEFVDLDLQSLEFDDDHFLPMKVKRVIDATFLRMDELREDKSSGRGVNSESEGRIELSKSEIYLVGVTDGEIYVIDRFYRSVRGAQKYKILLEYLKRLEALVDLGYSPFQFPDFVFRYGYEPKPPDSIFEELSEGTIIKLADDFRARLQKCTDISGVIHEPFITGATCFDKELQDEASGAEGLEPIFQRGIERLVPRVLGQDLEAHHDDLLYERFMESLPQENCDEITRRFEHRIDRDPKAFTNRLTNSRVASYARISGKTGALIARLRMDRIGEIQLAKITDSVHQI